MKRLLKRVLAPTGVVPRVSPTNGTADVDDRKDNWKAKASEAMARVRELEQELKQQIKRAEQFRLAAERLEKRGADLEVLQARLKDAERDLAVAREHLMAVEVKLDILEGAANVLDVRTRATIQQQTAETGARA